MLDDLRFALKAISIYRKASPSIKIIREGFNMKLSSSSFLQILAAFGQIGNLVLPLTSGKVQIGIAAALGAISVIVNRVAGHSNPDGTPAAKAYIPEVK